MPTDGEHAGVVSRVASRRRTRRPRPHAGSTCARATASRTSHPSPHGVRGHRPPTATTTSRASSIAADGHFSTVRRAWQPDAGPALGEWHAARQYFSGVHDRRLWVAFEQDLLPGYAWVFPLPGDRANVGFGVLRDGRKGHELKELWNDLLDATAACARSSAPTRCPKTVCARGRSPPATTGRRSPTAACCSSGDAAAVVDPMTGEGIAQAIETGMLAAAAVADLCFTAPTRRPSAIGTGARSRVRSAPICGSRRRCNGCSRAPRRTRRDPGRRHERLDPPQLRPVDVRGLSHGPRCSRPAAGTAGCSPRRASYASDVTG